MWSPDTSTVFASVADDGRLEIWDLKENYLSPVVTHFDLDADGKEDHTPKTVVRFTPNFSKMSPVVMTGNSKGEVDVYRTRGFEHMQVSSEDQWNRLLSSLKKDDFSGEKGDKEAEAQE
jgi:WD40 repeat protein